MTVWYCCKYVAYKRLIIFRNSYQLVPMLLLELQWLLFLKEEKTFLRLLFAHKSSFNVDSWNIYKSLGSNHLESYIHHSSHHERICRLRSILLRKSNVLFLHLNTLSRFDLPFRCQEWSTRTILYIHRPIHRKWMLQLHSILGRKNNVWSRHSYIWTRFCLSCLRQESSKCMT